MTCKRGDVLKGILAECGCGCGTGGSSNKHDQDQIVCTAVRSGSDPQSFVVT